MSDSESHSSENGSSSEEDFSSIEPYFSGKVWKSLTYLEKEAFRNQKERYEICHENGVPIRLPHFMAPKRKLGDRSIPSIKRKKQATSPSRKSSRHAKKTPDAPAPGGSRDEVDYSDPFQDELENREREQGQMMNSEVYVSENPNELADEIRAIMAKALPQARNDILLKVADHLLTQGVESLPDLALVQQDWIEGFDLNPIQVKKVLKCFSQLKLSVRQKKIVNTSSEPDVVSSRPSLTNFILTVDVMGKFSFSFGKLRESLLCSLEKKNIPSPKDREHLVFSISKDIVSAYEDFRAQNPTVKQKTPGRLVYRAIVNKIFEDFRDCFEDKLKDKVLGDGKFSLTDQFETCIENMLRQKESGRRTVSCKGNRKAACIIPEKYAPSLTKVQKAKGEGIRKELSTIYKGNEANWNWDTIREKMKEHCSFALQRAFINSKTRNVNDIMENWPFLFELNGILTHMEEVTGSQLLTKFEEYVLNDMETTIHFMTSESPKRIPNMKIQRNVTVSNGVHKKLIAVIMMIANHFGEQVELLVKTVPDTTLPNEVGDVIELPSTPCIVALGTSPFSAKTFYISMEQMVVSSALANGLEALVYLCSTYFVFGVLYPPGANAVLTYLERIVADLQDEGGLLKAQTPAGAVARSALSNVKNLEQAISKFEKSLNEED